MIRARLAALVLAPLLTLVDTASEAAERTAQHLSPAQLERAFRCIHRHEGEWIARTGNGYFGGLQMNASFMRAYGREYLTMWGTADRWPAYVQIAVAMRAYAVRGFSPWPTMRRRCGV